MRAPQSPLLKNAREAALIIVSILLAFLIDASWEGRQERREERELLENLQVEFRQTRELVSDAVRGHEGYGERALRLAEFGLSSGSEEPEDLARLINSVFLTYLTTYPETGVLDGTLASGRLDLVADDELRSRLAAWPRTFNEFREQEVFIEEWVREAQPVLYASVPLAAAVVAGARGESMVEAMGPEVRRFLASPQAQNYAAFRAFYESFAVNDGQDLVGALDDLLARLELEMR